MNTKSSILLAVIASFAIMMIPSEIMAEPTENTTTITPINDEISLQKTVTTMVIPENNTLPWGAVKGAASDYVERYPVIIQFYDDKEMIHVAQVDVKGDGSYEYKFRVRNIDSDGQVENIYQGQYTVMIFKVIHNQNQSI